MAGGGGFYGRRRRGRWGPVRPAAAVSTGQFGSRPVPCPTSRGNSRTQDAGSPPHPHPQPGESPGRLESGMKRRLGIVKRSCWASTAAMTTHSGRQPARCLPHAIARCGCAPLSPLFLGKKIDRHAREKMAKNPQRSNEHTYFAKNQKIAKKVAKKRYSHPPPHPPPRGSSKPWCGPNSTRRTRGRSRGS